MKIGIHNLFVVLVLFGLVAFPVGAFALSNQERASGPVEQQDPEQEETNDDDDFEDDWEDDDEDELAELSEEIRESEAEQLRLSRRLKFVAQRVRLLKKIQRLTRVSDDSIRAIEDGEAEGDDGAEDGGLELQVAEARLAILNQRMEAHDLLDELRAESDEAPAGLRETARDALKQLGECSRMVDAMHTNAANQVSDSVEQAEGRLLEAEVKIQRTWLKLELHFAEQEGDQEAITELQAELQELSDSVPQHQEAAQMP